MSTRTTVIVSLALMALAAGLSLAVYSRLPEAMASHWGVNDQVNGTMSRFWGAFLMPIMALGMLVLFLMVPGIDPLKANIAKFRGFFNAFIALLMAFFLYMHVLSIAWNLGFQSFKMSAALLPAVGLIFMFAGLMMRKAKRNYFIGIRTPWTLASDRVWDETHRVGAVLFIVSGALALLGAFFGGGTAFALVMIPVLGSALFTVVYSYVLWTKDQPGR